MKKPKTQRQLQVNERIKRLIAETFTNNGLSTICGGYVTILEADISPDMKNCKVFVNIFGSDNNKGKIITSLNNMAPRIRNLLSKDLTMRCTPEIKFILDESSQNAMNMDKLMKDESKNFEDI